MVYQRPTGKLVVLGLVTDYFFFTFLAADNIGKKVLLIAGLQKASMYCLRHLRSIILLNGPCNHLSQDLHALLAYHNRNPLIQNLEGQFIARLANLCSWSCPFLASLA